LIRRHNKESTMKKFAIALAILALAAPAFAVSPNVVISQVYGGGGSTSATAAYNQDYVELYNNSAVAVNISGWTIQYGSATGAWGSSASNIFTFPVGSFIDPCGYLLCGFGVPSSGGPALPIAADYTQLTGPTISATSGKIGLFNAVNTNLACGLEIPGTLVDKVAYGTANCAETTAVALLSVTTGAVRNGGGTIDTDSNVADFTVTTGPVPHNRASTTGCPVPAEAQSWGALKSTFR
jgi:hypothetical protein